MKPYSISHHTRLNPKKEPGFGKSKSVIKKKATASKDDRNYLSWLQINPFCHTCFVCGAMRVEWHHVKRYSSDKKDHKRLIPLCYDHHIASDVLSAHGTPKKWRETYSMEEQYAVADAIYHEYQNA